MRYRIPMMIALVLGAFGCAWQGTPVPVAGELGSLAGAWEGTYSSDENGRSGAISFQLDAATDSAFGNVWMSPPPQQVVQLSDAPRAGVAPVRSARALRIAFVRSERGMVSGRLEAYQDPVTGDRLLTVFEGRQQGDEFRGSYQTRNEVSGRVVRGEWSVRRGPPTS